MFSYAPLRIVNLAYNKTARRIEVIWHEAEYHRKHLKINFHLRDLISCLKLNILPTLKIMKTYNRESKARHSRLSNDREGIQLRIEIKTLKAVE